MGRIVVAELSVSFRISWIARLQRQRFDDRARALGLTRAQWRVIAAISITAGQTQSSVAAQLEVSNVTAGRIIDRLEENGWIERKSDPNDRRVNLLYLTPEATPMLEKLSLIGSDEEFSALAGMDEEERAQLARLLDKLIANMVPAPSDAPMAPDLVAPGEIERFE